MLFKRIGIENNMHHTYIHVDWNQFIVQNPFHFHGVKMLKCNNNKLHEKYSNYKLILN